MNSNSAVTVTSNPAFANAFAAASAHGSISVDGIAFAGTATGKRYNATTGGLIDTYGAGANFLPGSIAGTADASTFGLYI